MTRGNLPPACLPAGAIIVDESLTSGGSYFALSRGCPKFSHLTLTGMALLLPLPVLLPLPPLPMPAFMLPLRLVIAASMQHCHRSHCHVALCAGGAIGAGIPLAVGAAVACPDRVVINLQVGALP
jgi:acetolactate synthase-1/2/3 large subunit